MKKLQSCALPALLLASASAASAAPSVDVTAITTFIKVTVVDILLLIGAAGVLGALALAIFKFLGHNRMEGVAYLLGALLGGFVVGYATVWTASLTGISL